MTTQIFTDQLVIEHCCNCGMSFGMQSSYRDRKENDGGMFYCPDGHPQHYTDSNVTILRRQLEAKEWELKNAAEGRERAWKQNSTLNNRLRAQRGVTTRIKNRIVNGVCPGCKRSFQNLKAHMTTKHPNWMHTPEAASEPHA